MKQEDRIPGGLQHLFISLGTGRNHTVFISENTLRYQNIMDRI